MSVTPYLFFDGRCDEAIDFYKQAVGAEVEMLMRFKDAPPPPEGASPEECNIPPGNEDKVMHVTMQISGTPVMASDGCCSGESVTFSGISLSLEAKDEDEADRMFNALAEGGTVQMPMDKTFFAKRFGIVQDKFGVGWMVIVPPEEEA